MTHPQTYKPVISYRSNKGGSVQVYNKKIVKEGVTHHFATSLEMVVYAVNILGLRKESDGLFDGLDYALTQHFTDECYSEFGVLEGAYLYTENVTSNNPKQTDKTVWN
jgi:hypothetical protein